MLTLEPFHAALASLKANRLRSALTVLSIVIGVSAVITVVGLIQGFKGVVSGILERFGSNSLFVNPVYPGDMPDEEYKKIKRRDMTMYDIRALATELPQVILSVTPLSGMSATLRHAGSSNSTWVLMSDETWLEQNLFNLDMGRNFVSADMRLKSNVTIIGKANIESLGIIGNPLGQSIFIQNIGFEIIGVIEDLGSNMLEDSNTRVLIPITTGMTMISDEDRRHLSFSARYDPALKAEYVEDIVTDTLRRIRGLKSNDIEDFVVYTMKRVAAQFDNIFLAITGITSGMVSIALLVGGVGIMNIMLVSVTERTREIGVRKAVGAKRRTIMVQFLIEATMLCLFGGALGMLLGFLLSAAICKILLNSIPNVPLYAFVVGFGIPALIGIFFGYYPAAKASKLDPLERLRYE